MGNLIYKANTYSALIKLNHNPIVHIFVMDQLLI